MARTIIDADTKNSENPDVGTYSKVFYSETLTGKRTQIAFTKDIPALDEAPDAITGQALDLGYEVSAMGIKKADKTEMSVFYTHTQHRALRDLNGRTLYFFVQLPAHTAPEGTDPLVRYFKGEIYSTLDSIPVGDYLTDKITFYKKSDVEESEGFPVEQSAAKPQGK